MEILHGNRIGLEPRRTKHGHKSHILFRGIPILCRLPSLWCPLTHLSITKLTVSYQTCSEWFHLPLWKLAMGTVAGWSHPGPKSHEVSWPTGRPYVPSFVSISQWACRSTSQPGRNWPEACSIGRTPVQHRSATAGPQDSCTGMHTIMIAI